MKHPDQLASLLSPGVIPYAERINMPYLGYHLLRETITTKLLGESEAPILYWMGKDLGRQIAVQTANGLVLPFIRLGLGKLELLEESERHFRYRLFHSIYSYMTPERMSRALSLECGIVAGAIGRLREQDVETRLELEEEGSVIISVSLS
ncbi:DUF2507 domain-containing protein [Brevibacillus sp. H7]|jgi:hypothetical protein|uniref:DUF2507 domain-containing protein n=1 Tax=Brevibacillus sp. H7 TaxID=3349138 RepID=UPI00380368FC